MLALSPLSLLPILLPILEFSPVPARLVDMLKRKANAQPPLGKPVSHSVAAERRGLPQLGRADSPENVAAAPALELRFTAIEPK